MTERPPHAILLWSDENRIYAELPCATGGFYRMEFNLSQGGLSRALDLLKDHRPTPDHRPKYNPPPTVLKGYSPKQSALAADLVKRMKK